MMHQEFRLWGLFKKAMGTADTRNYGAQLNVLN